MSCPNLALVHTSIEHSRDWCRRLLILGCQEPYAHQALHPVRWCGRLLKTTEPFLDRVRQNLGFPELTRRHKGLRAGAGLKCTFCSVAPQTPISPRSTNCCTVTRTSSAPMPATPASKSAPNMRAAK
ncbi:hypothetical protein E5221_22240 [Pseudomonas sp. A2]|nr:hypothetical protein E5221_22240 [Pseudomonas sp. A2]